MNCRRETEDEGALDLALRDLSFILKADVIYWKVNFFFLIKGYNMVRLAFYKDH